MKKDWTEEMAAQVEELSGYGLPQNSIASVMRMSPKTLRKLYRDELDRGAARANAAVGKMLFQKAMEGDVTACIFWAKCRMRWRQDGESPDGEDSAPPKVTIRRVSGRKEE